MTEHKSVYPTEVRVLCSVDRVCMYGTVSGTRQRLYSPLSLVRQKREPPNYSIQLSVFLPIPISFLILSHFLALPSALLLVFVVHSSKTCIIFSCPRKLLCSSQYSINISSQWPPRCDWAALLSVLLWPSLPFRLPPSMVCAATPPARPRYVNTPSIFSTCTDH